MNISQKSLKMRRQTTYKVLVTNIDRIVPKKKLSPEFIIQHNNPLWSHNEFFRRQCFDVVKYVDIVLNSYHSYIHTHTHTNRYTYARILTNERIRNESQTKINDEISVVLVLIFFDMLTHKKTVEMNSIGTNILFGKRSF